MNKTYSLLSSKFPFFSFRNKKFRDPSWGLLLQSLSEPGASFVYLKNDTNKNRTILQQENVESLHTLVAEPLERKVYTG